MFAGYGPLPYPRRASVLLFISPSEESDDDDTCKRLGVIVAHRYGVHRCVYNGAAILEEEGNHQEAPTGRRACNHSYPHEDMRCYFCCENPFFEVLFHNPCAHYLEEDQSGSENEEEEDSWQCKWMTVPVTASRVSQRAVKVSVVA